MQYLTLTLHPAAGIIKAGEEVEIVGMQDTAKTVVTGVEMFKKSLNQGQAGDNVGLLLRSVKRDDILRGQVGSWAWPGFGYRALGCRAGCVCMTCCACKLYLRMMTS